MSKTRRRIVTALLVLAALLLVLVGAGVWLVMERPLTLERWAAVAALERAGLERRAVATPAGELAVWTGGGGDGNDAGDTLVLLHGAGDHAGAWAEVVPALAAEHRLVVADLPGHGDSAPDDDPLTMATVLAGVVGLLESDVAAASGPPVVVGNSLGGWLALLVGLEHPELASRLVVVNGGGTPGPVDPAVLLPADREEAAALFDLLGAPGPIPGPALDDVVRRVQDGALGRFMAADDHLDHALSGRMGAVAVPVDLVWGELDGYLPPSYAEATAAALPAARLTTIPDCGHVPPRYCPAAFTGTLTRVLAAPPPAPDAEPAAEPAAETAAAAAGEEAP